MTTCPGAVHVRRADDLALGRLLTRLGDLVSVQTKDGRHRSRSKRHRFLHVAPRRRTIRSASANDIVPAATLAEYSPRLWPATSRRECHATREGDAPPH